MAFSFNNRLFPIVSIYQTQSASVGNFLSPKSKQISVIIFLLGKEKKQILIMTNLLSRTLGNQSMTQFVAEIETHKTPLSGSQGREEFCEHGLSSLLLLGSSVSQPSKPHKVLKCNKSKMICP